MKALITAGGRGTRLRPITYTTNKHLIPLGNKPMIWYAIEKVVAAGISDIGININPEETEIQKAVGDGSRWGAQITYIKQTGGPQGLAHIIKVAEKFLDGDSFLFYLGDNIVLADLKSLIRRFERGKLDCLLALSHVQDPERFGVPVFENGKLVRVDEKPENPASNFAVTGIYVYSPAVMKAVHAIKPSARGELEISDAHTYLLQHGSRVGYQEITGWWKDTGKPFDILEGNSLILDQLTGQDIQGEVSPETVIEGAVRISKGARITGASVLRGPLVVGEQSILHNAYIAPYTSIGNNVSITNAEVDHSIILDGVSINTNKHIVDSIIGNNAQVTDVTLTRPSGHKLIVGSNSSVEI